MLAKSRVREVVKVRFTLFALVLLCVLTGRTALDNFFTLAIAEKHELTLHLPLSNYTSASKIDVTIYRDERINKMNNRH